MGSLRKIKSGFQEAENRGTVIPWGQRAAPTLKNKKTKRKLKLQSPGWGPQVMLGDSVERKLVTPLWCSGLGIMCDSLFSQVCSWRQHHLQPGPTLTFVQFRPLLEDEEREAQRRCRTWLKQSENLPVATPVGLKTELKSNLHLLFCYPTTETMGPRSQNVPKESHTKRKEKKLSPGTSQR